MNNHYPAWLVLNSNAPITNVSSEQAFEHLGQFPVIDVRKVDAFNDTLGHIHSAKLRIINAQLRDKLASESGSNSSLCLSQWGAFFACSKGEQSLGFPYFYNFEGGHVSLG